MARGVAKVIEVPVTLCWIVGGVVCVLGWLIGRSQLDASDRISEFQRTILHSTIAHERAMLKESMSAYQEAYKSGIRQGLADSKIEEKASGSDG